MCFYDQFQMACGDHRWGNFRQHCSKEYRTGETCGMKLVMNTIPKSEKCKLCVKIDTKRGRVYKEEDRTERWYKEEQRGVGRSASISASQEMIVKLQNEISDLEYQRSQYQSSTLR